MKKIGKGVIKIAIILIALMAMCFSTKVQAAELSMNEPLKVAKGGSTGGSLSQILDTGRNFLGQGRYGSAQAGLPDAEGFADQLAPIGSIIAGVGIIIFLGVGVVMGAKWAIAKPEDKAKLKQALVGYVIAAFVFFGAVGIWRLAIKIMEGIKY